MEGIFDRQFWSATEGIFDNQFFVAGAQPPLPVLPSIPGTASGGGGRMPRFEKLTVFKKIEKRKRGMSILEALRGPDPVEPPQPRALPESLQDQINAIRVDLSALKAQLGPELPLDDEDAEAETLLILSMLL